MRPATPFTLIILSVFFMMSFPAIASAQDMPVPDIIPNPGPHPCGQPIGFDGSGSYHENPMRVIVAFEWDFDYSTGSFHPQEFGPITYHAFSTFGTYIVALRVTDDIGQSAVATTTVDICLGNNPPIADANGPYFLELGNNLLLDASGSVDPDSECGDAIVEYAWDIDNDGVFEFWGETTTVPWAALATLPQPDIPNQINLRVTDSLGLYDLSQSTLTIYDTEPVAQMIIAPNPASAGQPVSFDGSESYHGNPGRTIVEWRWDFSYDGNFQAESFGTMTEHIFSTTGTHTIALQVFDDNQPPVMDMVTEELEIFGTSETAEGTKPETFHLYHNIPNPFNPMTTIYYDVPEGVGPLKIRLYDVQGRLVRELVNDNQTSGHKSVVWRGRNSRGELVASGVYYVVLQAPGIRQVRKVTLLE